MLIHFFPIGGLAAIFARDWGAEKMQRLQRSLAFAAALGLLAPVLSAPAAAKVRKPIYLYADQLACLVDNADSYLQSRKNSLSIELDRCGEEASDEGAATAGGPTVGGALPGGALGGGGGMQQSMGVESASGQASDQIVGVQFVVLTKKQLRCVVQHYAELTPVKDMFDADVIRIDNLACM